jgi:GPH family glycoside/pentoside/hexuronide:cation symporter
LKNPFFHSAGVTHLSRRDKILYGIGYVPDSIMNNTFFALIMVGYNVEFGLAASLVGLAMSLPRMYEAFLDPLIGSLSDRWKGPWGKRRPFLLIGSILGALGCVAFWSPPFRVHQEFMGLPGPWPLFGWLIGVAFFYYTAYAIYTVPYLALGLGMTTDDRARSELMGYRVAANNFVLCTIVPAASWLIYQPWLGTTPAESLLAIGGILALLVVGTGGVTALFTREGSTSVEIITKPVHKPSVLADLRAVLKNKPFLMVVGIVSFNLVSLGAIMSLAFFLMFSIVYPGGSPENKSSIVTLSSIGGFAGNICGFLLAPYVAVLSAHVGRKRLLLFALGNMIVAYLLSPLIFSPTCPWLFLVFKLQTTFSLTCVWILTLSMLADVSDMDELENGSRRDGLFSSMFNWSTKVAFSLSAVASGLAIDCSGFKAELGLQSPETITFLRWVFALGPLPFFIASIYFTAIFPYSPEKTAMLRKMLAGRVAPPEAIPT